MRDSQGKVGTAGLGCQPPGRLVYTPPGRAAAGQPGARCGLGHGLAAPGPCPTCEGQALRMGQALRLVTMVPRG
jgi:hypothetical protein